MKKKLNVTRRNFFQKSMLMSMGVGMGFRYLAAEPLTGKNTNRDAQKSLVIDSMMHLEVYQNDNFGLYWPGMEEDILQYYDRAGIDKGVILTTWTPSKESNDRTLRVYEKYPDRFIPFGHVRPVDKDWEEELKRISKPPWKGLKLHEGELRVGGDLRKNTIMILSKVEEYDIPVVKIHLQKWPIVQEIVEKFKNITFIFPHMGAYNDPSSTHVKDFCELARDKDNVFLDTSGFSNYWEFPHWFNLAGVENICFASDGFYLSPLVEKAKVETVGMPTPTRKDRLNEKELKKILGGNIARILKL